MSQIWVNLPIEGSVRTAIPVEALIIVWHLISVREPIVLFGTAILGEAAKRHRKYHPFFFNSCSSFRLNIGKVQVELVSGFHSEHLKLKLEGLLNLIDR